MANDATSIPVEAALETDEALAERLAVFLNTRLAVAGAMKPLIDEQVPDALVASVRRTARSGTRNVVSSRVREIHPLAEPWMMPLADSILAVITGAGGFVAGRGGLSSGSSFGEPLIAALEGQPSASDVDLADLKRCTSCRDSLMAGANCAVSTNCCDRWKARLRLLLGRMVPGSPDFPFFAELRRLRGCIVTGDGRRISSLDQGWRTAWCR